MRSALNALGRNLASGLRLALFMPIERRAFRITPAQLVLVAIVSAAIDIDADWARAAHDARFSILGLHGELFALGLLVLSSAIIAVLRRDTDLYLALPIVILASFPAIQIVHLLPDLPGASRAGSETTRRVFEYAIFAWMLALAMRAVYLCVDPQRPRRRAWAVGGGLLVIAPIWFSPLVGPLEPWWRGLDVTQNNPDAINPASEPVLAAQAFIMDRALDQLEDGRPGATDLYFVGFAPDARRPGFAADVAAAQRAMDERWRTNGRSVVLVNSPLTVAERPFATITNLRETLLGIADVIDADEDIVMVYLTGSSGADHALTAVNPPLELVNLSPLGLKQLLDAAGIRWRVIVVATCGAGAWLDALQDDQTAVIASSAAGVRSDDCTGGVGASRFGEAFFDAMRQTDDLMQALVLTRKRLSDRHGAEPVSAIGPAIAERLKTLRTGSTERVVARVAPPPGR